MRKLSLLNYHNWKRESFVYFIRRLEDGAIKIGWTQDIVERFNALAQAHGKLELLAVEKGGPVKEKGLHEHLEEYRIGKTEWFLPNQYLAKEIAELRFSELFDFPQDLKEELLNAWEKEIENCVAAIMGHVPLGFNQKFSLLKLEDDWLPRLKEWEESDWLPEYIDDMGLEEDEGCL